MAYACSAEAPNRRFPVLDRSLLICHKSFCDKTLSHPCTKKRVESISRDLRIEPRARPQELYSIVPPQQPRATTTNLVIKDGLVPLKTHSLGASLISASTPRKTLCAAGRVCRDWPDPAQSPASIPLRHTLSKVFRFSPGTTMCHHLQTGDVRFASTPLFPKSRCDAAFLPTTHQGVRPLFLLLTQPPNSPTISAPPARRILIVAAVKGR